MYFVELEADLDERLERNKTPHRLQHKPTKRNMQRSERDLVKSMDQYRLNSNAGEIGRENYIRINNTDLNATEVAQHIKEYFDL